MTKNPARLVHSRTVPLMLLLLGLLGMHVLAGSHGPSAPVFTSSAAAPHHGGAQPDAGVHPAGEETGEAAVCGDGCGAMEMTMVSCVLALLLIATAVLARLPLLRRRLLLPQPTLLPTLLHTQAPRRGPSLVQLSISRT